MNQPCPFCSLSIQEQIFWGLDKVMAVYNISPILPGHSMIIPRRHVVTINELDNEEMTKFFTFARQVTQLLMRAFEADGFDWSLQESEAAGQSFAHLHLHIIPRKTGDLKRPGDWYALLQQNRHVMIDNPDRKLLAPNEISNIIEFIKSHKH
ncbi:MAG: HIT domain-containing protein [Bacteroidales bacterium]|nr:HIT domain-containing protein [Bacteroidales bacterium]